MQLLKNIFRIVLFLTPLSSFSQSSYLPQGDKATHFVERMEIKQQTNTDLNFSTLKPLSRKAIVREAEFLDSARMAYPDSLGVDKYPEWTDLALTSVDEYNLKSLLMNNSEWVRGSREGFSSKRPLFNTFYKTKANMIEVNNPDFFLAVNPILNISQSIETGSSERVFLNSRGVSARGLIAGKIGFSTYVTDNQERGPEFYRQKIRDTRAVPGFGYYQQFKQNAVDYFDARGSITFGAADGHVNVQFGYDKNFIGNGYRSLFLSDFGNSNLFLKVNTKIWKLNYQNLFMELQPQFTKTKDTVLDRKYAAMHHLSMNVTKWLNVGVFESIIFGRRNRFDFQYLNPIIFYRHIEGTIGSPDNALAGIDFKANLAHRVQVYGQAILDEFRINDLRKNPKSWVNKYGYQLGIKYVDAFGANNLDIQVETNRVRPFTYSHYDTTANYTHYNQPLAHPLGANFQELVVNVRYQPAPKWVIDATGIFYNKGLDTAGYNYGGDIFKNYITRSKDDGLFVGIGDKAKCLNIFATVSYEVKENLFLEGSFQHRNFTTESGVGEQNTTLISAGVRLNIFRRKYDY